MKRACIETFFLRKFQSEQQEAENICEAFDPLLLCTNFELLN